MDSTRNSGALIHRLAGIEKRLLGNRTHILAQILVCGKVAIVGVVGENGRVRVTLGIRKIVLALFIQEL